MIGNIYFQIAGVLYIALFIWVFFLKRKKDTVENNILITIVGTTMLSLICDVLNTYCIINYTRDNFLSHIITKCNLSLILIFGYLITLYIYILSFNKTERISKDKKNILHKFINKTKYIIIAIVLLTLALPIKVDILNGAIYATGTCVSYIYIVVTILILSCITRYINRKKEIKYNKKKIILVLITLTICTLLIEITYPELLIINLIKVFIPIYIYFTIDNPDMEVIDELKEARIMVESINAEKSDVLLNISHNIRTPLNTIIGFSESLMEEKISKEAKEDVKYIMKASHNLLDIVNSLLDENAEALQKLKIKEEEYDIEKLLKQITIYTQDKIKSNKVEFKYNITNKIPKTLYGDKLRVKQIILNLINNAIEYTEEGYIELNVDGILKGNIYRLIITVEDTGKGISSDKINRIFYLKDKNANNKELSINTEGSNLIMTKKLVELMNGRITVNSEENEGSKFTVIIDQKLSAKPLKIEKTINDKEVINNVSNPINIDGKKILIVDDNEMNLKVATRLLKPYNITTTEVTSGLECINKINDKNEYDLIFLDDMMPGMSGIETLERLKKKTSFNTPVIALTANATSGMKQKYIDKGFDDYIAKPIDRKELKRVLNKFLSERNK